ncbi:hypothetical protein V6N11_032445 [Hibiscus sabdariffa]|uniref:DCD domain-containing protein n=1 Tax=Hibiscus sabdariffa TaxID=183260 RepID=A0ABR2T0U5_9ROSI
MGLLSIKIDGVIAAWVLIIRFFFEIVQFFAFQLDLVSKMRDAKKNGFPGSCPESGAIFMSDNATKKECLRRKVFALPSSQSHFVKQVKAGMILFLFEFERRELHGVFRACSDGAMNILPYAFSSSGKQFPAQVKITPMWYCHPLSEKEFSDAIRENYFSKTKFNFGLSEDQVRRLLSLFSLKRMKDPAPRRRLTESQAARQSGYFTSKNRRLVDMSPMRNQVPSEYGVDDHHRPDISTISRGNSFYNDDGPTDDGRFGTYTDVGYEDKANGFLNECFRGLVDKVGGDIVSGKYATSDGMDTEWKTGIEHQEAVSVGYSSGNFRSISNDVRFAQSDRIETKCYKDDGFSPTISTAYPNSFQSKDNPLVYSSKHVLEKDPFINGPTRPSSTFLPSMEMQNSNFSYPTNFEDSIVANSLLHDSDNPTMNYKGSSSLGFNQGHASLQDASHDGFVSHVIGTSKNQSFPSLLEAKRTPITTDVNSGSRDLVTLPYSNSFDHNSRTILKRPDYLDDLAVEYSKTKCSGDLSFPKPSLAPIPSSEIRNNGRIGDHSSSYRTSPSRFPSLTFSDKYPTLLQDRHDFQVQECDRYPMLLQDRHDFQVQERDRYPMLQDRHDFQVQESESDNDGFMFKECQPHDESFYNDNRTIKDDRLTIYNRGEYENKEAQQQLRVHEPINVYHEVSSFYPASYQNSDHRKKRSSVFSRLALPPKIRRKEKNTSSSTADISRHTSINEVMDMPHQSCNHGVRSGKPLVKHSATAANLRDKKQATMKDDPDMISKENLKSTSFSKENSSQKIGETTFVDFKRRSAVRKNLEDGKTGDHCAMISKEMNLKSTLFSKENNSQKIGETTCVGFKRRSAVRKNLEDGETEDHCETWNEKSAAAAQRKRRKLIRPDFCQSESSDRGISDDAPQLAILASTECSVNKNAESIMVSVVHVNEKDILSNVKLPNAMCQNAIKGNNSDNGSGLNSEQFSAENFIDSRSSDGGKESSKRHCISSMTSISCRNTHDEVEQDMNTRDTGKDGQNDVTHSTHESCSKICEDNDGDGVAKNKFVCSIERMNDLTPGLSQDRNDVSHTIHVSSPKICGDNDGGIVKSKFVCNIEQMNDLTPGLSQDRNDVNHSTCVSSPKICEDNDGGIAKGEFVCNIEQMDLTPGLSRDQNDVSHSTHVPSPKICEDNDGVVVAKSECVFHIEQVNDLSSGLSQYRNDVGHSTHESGPKVCEDDNGDEVAKSEFVCNIEQMNDSTPGLSQDQNEVSLSTHESSPKICEANDGDGAAKSEFVYSIEQIKDLTPVGGAPALLNGMSFVEGWEHNFFVSKWSNLLLNACSRFCAIVLGPYFEILDNFCASFVFMDLVTDAEFLLHISLHMQMVWMLKQGPESPVGGNHRGILCEPHLFRILKHWLKVGNPDPLYNPINDYMILPTAFEMEILP